MTNQPLIFVRAATSADNDFLSDLLSHAREESQTYRGKTLSHSAYSENNFCLIAGVGETSMGALEVEKISEQQWMIRFVYVQADCREIGIGDALMQHIVRHAQASGVSFIESSAQPGDRATKNLFERHGLVAQTIIVGKLL